LPISNLAIQRRRLNELKKLGFKDPQPDTFDSCTDFSFPVEKFTTQDAMRLNQIQFYVNDIQAFGGMRLGERFAGMSVSVHKDAIERKQPFKKQKLGGIQN
jgi:hypothetical protein